MGYGRSTLVLRIKNTFLLLNLVIYPFFSFAFFCACTFSTDERLNLVENVTEEVQSLRNRVELLEKVCCLI